MIAIAAIRSWVLGFRSCQREPLHAISCKRRLVRSVCPKLARLRGRVRGWTDRTPGRSRRPGNLVFVWVRFPPLRCRGESMSPMRATDPQSSEAGTKGGNPECGRESRRAELNMDRHTNPLPNRRQCMQAHPRLRACPKRERMETRAISWRPGALSHPFRRKMGSYVQRQTEARNGVIPSGLSGHPP